MNPCPIVPLLGGSLAALGLLGLIGCEDTALTCMTTADCSAGSTCVLDESQRKRCVTAPDAAVDAGFVVDSGAGVDAGPAADAGVVDVGPFADAEPSDLGALPADSGLADGGEIPDAAEPIDAGTPAPDAGFLADASEPLDVGSVDGGNSMGARDAGALDASGPACIWITITECTSGSPISAFCPDGRSVSRMERCNGTFYSPDATYQMFLLSRCPDSSCPVSPTHVSWSAVECCD